MFNNLLEKVLEKVAVKSAASASMFIFYEPEVPKEVREMICGEGDSSKSGDKEQKEN